MNILRKNAKNYFKKFIDWGGLLTTVDYLLDGHFGRAFLVLLILAVAVRLAEYYSD